MQKQLKIGISNKWEPNSFPKGSCTSSLIVDFRYKNSQSIKRITPIDLTIKLCFYAFDVKGGVMFKIRIIVLKVVIILSYKPLSILPMQPKFVVKNIFGIEKKSAIQNRA